MRAPRTSITGSQDNISGQLAFNVQVELLNRALPEVAIHGLDGSGVTGRICRPGQNGTTGDWSARRSAHRNQEASGGRATKSKTEVAGTGIHLSIVRRVLPQALSALVPGGIMENSVAGADHRLV